MRRSARLLVLGWLGGFAVTGVCPAWADEELEVRDHERSELLAPGPRLELDPVLRPRLKALTATEEQTDQVKIGIGANTSFVLEGVRWINDDATALPHQDLAARGWHAIARLSHDFGVVRVGVYASVNNIDSRDGSGNYRELGLSVSRTFRLSRWMTGWISLSVGNRSWLGEAPPPAGETDATEAMLSIGTTFR